MDKVGKTRSKTGCRTCRIRKVKCDEEKHRVPGLEEPQCKRCKCARIRCEWKGGPVPRTPAGHSPGSKKSRRGSYQLKQDPKRINCWEPLQYLSPPTREKVALLSPLQRIATESSNVCLQAANSLSITNIDRECIDYLETSTLVILLGKNWRWSLVSYVYHKIAAAQPMVMSMLLASAAREIHRSRQHDQKYSLSDSVSIEAYELSGQSHYGRALSILREDLKKDVKSPQHVEAIYITLWLMIDYENRFGGGDPAINIHIRGVESMLHNHVVPALPSPACGDKRSPTELLTSTCSHIQENDAQNSSLLQLPNIQDATSLDATEPSTRSLSLYKFNNTAVPIFFLLTLYHFTPAALAFGPGTPRVDTDICRFFLGTESCGNGHLTLPELYRTSRQSASRFWGEEYPLSAQLDELENLPGLTLYHHSHVIQFKITELYHQRQATNMDTQGSFQYQRIINSINAVTSEYGTVLATAQLASPCDAVEDGRRVMNTVYWASTTFYSVIIYFHLCFNDSIGSDMGRHKFPNLMPLHTAISNVLELSLKLYRSRPRVLTRITWPLFIAGIATPDKIYQDWVSVRLCELGRYGQNFARISERFDEIIRSGADENIHHAIQPTLNLSTI